MYVVGVAQLASDLDSEAYALAETLGLSAYDLRMRLSGTLPRVVFQSQEKAAALHALSAIRARGNGAIAFDTDSIKNDAEVVSVHRFTVDSVALSANGPNSPRFPFAELACVVVVAARTDVFRMTKEKEPEVGGYRTPAMANTEHIGHEHVIDQCAYLYRAPHEDGFLPRPWLLHERDVQYLALGPRMRPTRRENFTATINLLREYARECQFDTRFRDSRIPTNDLIAISGHGTAQTGVAPRGVEVIASMTALWLMRARGPYR